MRSASRFPADLVVVIVALVLGLTGCADDRPPAGSVPTATLTARGGGPTIAPAGTTTSGTPSATPAPGSSSAGAALPTVAPAVSTPPALPPVSSAATAAAFASSSRALTAAEQAAMTGVSWRPGCPVPLADLRRLTVSFVGFDGTTRQGVLVVHASAVAPLTQVFRELHAARFPIRGMQPVEAYGGDDWTSIEADNTSAFNCRLRTGSTSEWSRHSYGLALDLNPLENPYVTSGTTSHPRSRPFLDRSSVRPGMITGGSAAVAAFTRVGWSWGGTWSNPVDLQHFSDNGR